MVSPRSISIWNPSKVFLIFYFARNLRERILLCGNFYDRFHWHSFIMSYLFNVWMGYSFVKFFVFTNVTQMKMFALFFPIILLLIFLYIIFFIFFLSFFQPWWCSINNQREIGTEIFRSTGEQNINLAVFKIELTVSEMLQWLSVNRDVTKSLLPANFARQKRPFHQLKLL